MNWPEIIDVFIEGDDTGRKARKMGYDARYNACEYKDDQERSFFVDPDYLQQCLEAKKLVNIPAQVITQLQETRDKLAWAQEQLFKEKKEKDSGLVLPDGYKV